MPNEPTDVGPLFGGNQPVSVHDRQLVTDLLIAARNCGRLSDQDYSWRMQRLQWARRFDELVEITRDLMSG